MKFKEKVLKAVQKILRGKTMTYAQVARAAGSPRAWRAVGNILNKNRDSKVPCHRVIRSDGKIGGYDKGTKKKTALLKKEGVIKLKQQKHFKIKKVKMGESRTLTNPRTPFNCRNIRRKVAWSNRRHK